LQKRVADGNGFSMRARDQDIPETMDVDSNVKLQMLEHKVDDITSQLN